ncbi:MAG: hypothetical protein ABW122_10325 [Ilumatobacteraceae bacterium]
MPPPGDEIDARVVSVSGQPPGESDGTLALILTLVGIVIGIATSVLSTVIVFIGLNAKDFPTQTAPVIAVFGVDARSTSRRPPRASRPH